MFCLSLRVLIDVHWGRLNHQLKVKRPEQDSKGLKVVCERVCEESCSDGDSTLTYWRRLEEL